MARLDYVTVELPYHLDEVVTCCNHPECNEALFFEIWRVGDWDAEDLCVVRERQEEIAFYEAQAAADMCSPEWNREAR